MVAPFTGAWIEIKLHIYLFLLVSVAPFTGAWIEIRTSKTSILLDLSLPSRERGLKLLW